MLRAEKRERARVPPRCGVDGVFNVEGTVSGMPLNLFHPNWHFLKPIVTLNVRAALATQTGCRISAQDQSCVTEGVIDAHLVGIHCFECLSFVERLLTFSGKLRRLQGFSVVKSCTMFDYYNSFEEISTTPPAWFLKKTKYDITPEEVQERIRISRCRSNRRT
eukprot:814435-Rhodomonas_salina.2